MEISPKNDDQILEFLLELIQDSTSQAHTFSFTLILFQEVTVLSVSYLLVLR